jgi:hypothetical protein
MSMVATTVAAQVGANSVAAGTTRQLTFFPGHSALGQTTAVDVGSTVAAVVSDMDEVAYHYQFQLNTSTVTCFGPVDFIDCVGTTRAAAAYLDSANVPLGTALNSPVTTTNPIGWGSKLPITGDVRLEGHLRCKLLSMGIKVVNTTPELSRGGSFVSWQPVTNCDIFSPQSANTIHPSWKDWGPDGCTVTWIPRLRDLAYWHPTAGGTLTSGVVTGPIQSSSFEGAGIVICINNPTATAQTFDVEVVAHWEISGYSVQTLSDQVKSTIMSDSVLKGALSAQTTNAPTASGIVETFKAAAGFVEKVAPRVGAAGAAAATVAMNALK